MCSRWPLKNSTGTLAKFEYDKYLIVILRKASAVNHARLVSPSLFCFDFVSQKHKP